MLLEESKCFQLGETQYVIRRTKGKDVLTIIKTFPSYDRCDSEGDPIYEHDYSDLRSGSVCWEDDEKLEKQILKAFGVYI